MARWSFERHAYPGGRFQLVIAKTMPGGRTVDASFVRGAPTLLDSFADADPFGDSTAQFTMPAITPFDDLSAPELSGWLGHYSNVDLYWVPTVPIGDTPTNYPVIDPLTNRPDVFAPTYLLNPDGSQGAVNRIKVWEGFIATLDFHASGTDAGLQISCQGALFQLDRYLAKPFFPAQAWPLELLIQDAFKTTARPHLRTRNLTIAWPSGWRLVVPRYTGTTPLTPVGKPGSKWSGYTSRQTGSWDHALTNFVQNQLTLMITDERSGVTPGNQWTVQHQHTSLVSPGRAPILAIRDRMARTDFSLQLGTPGVEARLSSDSTQSFNVVFGDGTSIDGTKWRNAVISNDGRRTDYLPLAASRDVYPVAQNKQYLAGAFTSEAVTHFDNGYDQPDAATVAAQWLARDRDPGWTGTITLSVDPSPTLPRWLIRAGMTVVLKGFAGSGARGLRFHIASCTKSPEQGTVELTVDTRYRDLLTVEEARARTRDPLTPVRMLQVNRTSVTIEDIQAPWDYRAGSGYVPKESMHFHEHRPNNENFPYVDWVRRHPPLHYGQWYVRCKANAPSSRDRWAGPIPVLMSEQGTINRSEFLMVDAYGRTVKKPFHVSVYDKPATVTSMPHLLSTYSPYLDNAFERIHPRTGQQNNPTLQGPLDDLWIGWGNRSDGIYNRAGFYPGRESDGASPTGLLVDDAEWQWNCLKNPMYQLTAKPGQRQKTYALQVWVMFYCEHTSPVYFMGRFFRMNQGTG